MRLLPFGYGCSGPRNQPATRTSRKPQKATVQKNCWK
jgi:hypothetical protein